MLDKAFYLCKTNAPKFIFKLNKLSEFVSNYSLFNKFARLSNYQC